MHHPAFAVVISVPQFCPSTDAFVGTGRFVKQRCLTKAEAQSIVDVYNGSYMYSDGCHAEFVISPYKEGEGDLPPPRNALEDYYDHKAWSRDRSSPSWAQ